MDSDLNIAKRSGNGLPRFMSPQRDNFDRKTSDVTVVTPNRHLRLLRKLSGAQKRPGPPDKVSSDGIAAGVFHSIRTTNTDSAQEGVAKITQLQPGIAKNSRKLPKFGSKSRANPLAHASNSEYTRAMDSTLDIYSDHFGLSQRPFSLVPDPTFLYWSSSHRRAYTMLEYGILTSAPITLITGEVGAGKTTLLQHLLKNIGAGVKVGLISNAHGSRGELLQWVLMSLDQPAPDGASYVSLFDAFQKYLALLRFVE